MAFSFLKRNRKIGLALGGGAARGLAHIGVLKALTEAGIHIDYVAGTSAGSIIGALYCAGYTWEEIKEIANNINWGKLIAPTVPIKGLVKTDKLEKLLEKLLKKKSFNDLAIPFRAVAVDISRGEEVVLHKGSAAKAVQASSSIPGIFEPTELDGRLLVDGGLMNNVPADTVRDMGAGIVIAVDLNHYYPKLAKPRNIIEIIYSSLFIIMNNKSNKTNKFTDYLVAPDLSRYSYTNFKNMNELIQKGEQAMIAYIPQIKKKL
ncbi:MAG: patatin-like phospholipase family protein [Spirochaetales bacterium]|nr:patatin-like phospholipase family protein [Spirochaetales bacterium]